MKVTAKPHLRVRSGPGAEFREVGQLPTNALVTVLEQAPGGKPWVYVAERNGWVSKEYLVEEGGGGKWRTAKSLVKLGEQVDAAAPERKKSHDGTIGDTAHQARKSDHNPNDQGVVTARDFTHDPAGGCDCQALAEKLVASKDPRVKYIIWRGRIISSKQQPWVWRKYNGANPHMAHLHVSVDADSKLYDDERPWAI